MAALPTSADAVAQSILAPSAEQWKTIYFIIGYVVGICVLWHLPYLQYLLYPFKLVTIAFHEFGHAAAGKCTGAQIEGIEVDPNEGGVTRMRGGTQCVTLPAGYIGSTVFGGVMVFAGFDILASKVVSILVSLALLVTLYWARNMLTRVVTLGFIGLIALLWWVPQLDHPDVHGYYLKYFILFMGVMSALYSLWDIIEDLVLRKAHGSDAVQYARVFGGWAKCWGSVWFVISLFFVGVAIICALIVFREPPPAVS